MKDIIIQFSFSSRATTNQDVLTMHLLPCLSLGFSLSKLISFHHRCNGQGLWSETWKCKKHRKNLSSFFSYLKANILFLRKHLKSVMNVMNILKYLTPYVYDIIYLDGPKYNLMRLFPCTAVYECFHKLYIHFHVDLIWYK